jgi:hypothetical protein
MLSVVLTLCPEIFYYLQELQVEIIDEYLCKDVQIPLTVLMSKIETVYNLFNLLLPLYSLSVPLQSE